MKVFVHSWLRDMCAGKESLCPPHLLREQEEDKQKIREGALCSLSPESTKQYLGGMVRILEIFAGEVHFSKLLRSEVKSSTSDPSAVVDMTVVVFNALSDGDALNGRSTFLEAT